MKHVLRTEHLTKKYGGKAVVKDVSIEMESGQIVGLLGPNGAGKSTTFYMIAGIIAPDEGSVVLDEKEFTQEPMYIRARNGIGYLPQEPSIFRGLTARQNIQAVLELQDLKKNDINTKVEKLLEEFGLQGVKGTKGSLLSGGERRRVEIARALAANPLFILLDEPFAGIDPITINELQENIIKLKEKGIGIIITDHNIQETLRITDKAYILSRGEVLKEGSPAEIAEDPLIREVYLGKEFTLI
ncbi:MAG: LPS export ABC transporter ATP-binding protein [Acidobacteria bacterium]|nr:MAG: LPS export ABC transporter ATP-binding protein [Acidobacteriota bacterium]RLE24472.1 MAG: LPS export ABC transporter ATP-binding protein [Acidobacteriota bacterium]